MKFTEDFNSIKSIVISTFAVIAILFFGFTAYYGIRKFGNKEAGLILDENGITDHSSATSIGFIPWSDITNITQLEIMNVITLMIHVKTPEEYINKAQGLKRKILQANLNNYQTPFGISSNNLKITNAELEALVEQYFNNYLNS